MKIYLAGGLKSGWQLKVKMQAPQHKYFDPVVDTNQKAAYCWTSDEIFAIKNSNLIFAYYEKDNPSGQGLALEIGVALSSGIPVWYVDEHEQLNAFLCACSQKVYSNFQKAVEDLAKCGY